MAEPLTARCLCWGVTVFAFCKPERWIDATQHVLPLIHVGWCLILENLRTYFTQQELSYEMRLPRENIAEGPLSLITQPCWIFHEPAPGVCSQNCHHILLHQRRHWKRETYHLPKQKSRSSATAVSLLSWVSHYSLKSNGTESKWISIWEDLPAIYFLG